MPPAPKNAATRQRRNRTTTAATLSAPAVSIAPLPTRFSTWKCASCYLEPGKHTGGWFDKEDINPHEFAAEEVPWNAMTIVWWETIWASPMVEEWVDADVPGLMALAMLWDSFFRFGDGRMHAEARMASREFGLSPLSRRQLQWEVKRLESAAPAPVTPTRQRDPRLRAI